MSCLLLKTPDRILHSEHDKVYFCDLLRNTGVIYLLTLYLSVLEITGLRMALAIVVQKRLSLLISLQGTLSKASWLVW